MSEKASSSNAPLKLKAIVKKNLGLADEDLTISRFIVNLYEKAKSEGTADFERFEVVIKENGGEDFPPEFIKEAYNALASDQDAGSQIGGESKSPKHNGTSMSKQFPALSLPDKKVEVSYNGTGKNRGKEYSRDRNEVIIGEVCKGYVSNLTAYGAFMRLKHPRSLTSGLCHISQISFDGRIRVRHPSDVLKMNQEVFVKVKSIDSMVPKNNDARKQDKISLTMRYIDQDTGLDREEEMENESNETERGRENNRSSQAFKPKRRLTSPERWEIRQLIASGAATLDDYPELNEMDDSNDNENVSNDQKSSEVDVDVDITLKNQEPRFLKGQTNHAAELSPVKVVKNPEGSLARTAMNGSKLVKEFKEERMKQDKEIERKERMERNKKMDVFDPMASKNNDDRSDPRTQSVIESWKKSQKKQNITYGKRSDKPIKEQRESLPVFAMRSQIIETVRNNQFVVVVGETGSGKTTQIVQYLYEEGYNQVDGKKRLIGCTQPRRVAAVSVAKRVAEEVGCKLGDDVGYTIRFEDVTSASTKIKYMTDGMLQREALTNPNVENFSVIMLDEAHERTLATDVLFGLLKKAAMNNPDLKIIVTSATLDSAKFSEFFNNCPVLNIPGRTFPVEVLYAKEPEVDYLAAALDSVIQIHVSEPKGDILVFLTGQEEIDTSCEVLYQRVQKLGDAAPELIILPVYSALPSEMQTKIFEPTPQGSRKVILATNIAETSITIDGIYYVVDPGFVKVNAYNSRLGMDTLMVSPISQAQANQRSGRAGRTGPGKCYRLYTEKAYKMEMLPNSIPEIQRQNLTYTILMLKTIGVNDLFNFDFMDPPPTNTMITALQDLYTLSALDDEGYLTPLGRKMADFPMEPALAKTLIASVEFGCSDEILSIVAMLSVQTVFYRPKEKQNIADQKKAKFHHHHGDHLTLLNVYKAWSMNNFSNKWCQENFIHERSMRRVQDVRRQLAFIMSKYRHPIISCGMQLDNVRRALCAGFFKHSAKRDPQEGYKTIVEQTPVSLHPSSAIFGKSPEFVIYHSLLLTTKEYMHCVTHIDPKWLTELAPTFFKIADPASVHERNKKQKIVPLFDKFAKDQEAWRLTTYESNRKRALGNR